MSPTNEQIFAEAIRRQKERGGGAVTDFIIEVTRENWTPPAPVDPDVLAFREFALRSGWTAQLPSEATVGELDNRREARAFLAGARMAREQERERAKELVEFIGRVRPGVFNNLDHANHEARKVLAKHRGEA